MGNILIMVVRVTVQALAIAAVVAVRVTVAQAGGSRFSDLVATMDLATVREGRLPGDPVLVERHRNPSTTASIQTNGPGRYVCGRRGPWACQPECIVMTSVDPPPGPFPCDRDPAM